MRIDSSLNQQLRDWAAAVVGDQVMRTTANGTERLDFADDLALLAVQVMRVESIVQCMESTGRWKEARVLRAEYCMGKLSESDRLSRMSRLGLKISRASYYSYLASAHAFVAGALLFSSESEAA